jgi:3-hydroxyisobutyrate dehydrogenase-like beta-hydroxyacid dehydrogenase
MQKEITEPSSIGLIGVGLLGQALAEAMYESGFAVMGWDREPARCRGAESIADVFENCSRILLCLPTYENSRAVLAEAPLRPGHMIADISTGSPDDAEALATALAAQGVLYADATVSGSSAQALRHELLVMAGGDASVIETFRDVFATFASNVMHVGPAGSGAKMKLVTNLVLGLNRAALAEGLAFASSLGLDGTAALDVMRRSMAYSRIMDTKGEKMVQRDFTTQAKLSQHLKDVLLMIKASDLALPLTEAHRALLEKAVALGLGDLDNSAIIRTYEASP